MVFIFSQEVEFFSLVTSDRTQEKGRKLSQGGFTGNIFTQEIFFTQRVIEYWNMLSREMDTAPSLTKLKKHLNTLS